MPLDADGRRLGGASYICFRKATTMPRKGEELPQLLMPLAAEIETGGGRER